MSEANKHIGFPDEFAQKVANISAVTRQMEIDEAARRYAAQDYVWDKDGFSSALLNKDAETLAVAYLKEKSARDAQPATAGLDFYQYQAGEGPTVGDSVECVDPGDSRSLKFKHVYTVALTDEHFVYLAELGRLNGYYPSRFRLLSRTVDRVG